MLVFTRARKKKKREIGGKEKFGELEIMDPVVVLSLTSSMLLGK